MTREVVRAGIDERRARLGVETIDLMQLHWWSFEHPGYLDAMRELAALREEGAIRQIGVTNFDTDHLRVLVRHGFPVATNQVSFSLLDRRAAGGMSAFCLANGVPPPRLRHARRRLPHRPLGRRGGAGGDRRLEQVEIQALHRRDRRLAGAADASVDARRAIAKKHRVSVANVATRWVLEQPAVAAVIVGARLGESEHRADNAALFSFALDDDDRAQIAEALAEAHRIPGDCGDEYRKPALPHRLGRPQPSPRAAAARLSGGPGRGPAEPPAHRFGQRLGADLRLQPRRARRRPHPRQRHDGDARRGRGRLPGRCRTDRRSTSSTRSPRASPRSAACLEDVVRTRIYLRNADDWEPVSRVHGRYFGATRPANTLFEIGRLVGDYAVEIEAEAVVG